MAFLIVLAAAIGIAAFMLADYYRAPDLLWRSFYHDRNSHYSFGLDLALAIRNLDPAWFFSELEKAKVWPPVHGLVLSAVLTLGGIDYRLAIVPSLIGFVATIAFSWLIARRLFADRVEGLLAAAIAVVFIAASPVFRLISADVMLEGLGAGLSAMALWAYLRAMEQPDSAARWRLVAIVLTVLFFHKGNYWGLLVAAMAIAFAAERGRQTAGAARVLAGFVAAPAPILRAVLHPLLIAAALAIALVAYVYHRGPTALTIFGRSVSLYPPENLTTLAYALVFVWWAGVWWRHRATIERALGAAGRAMLYWHLTPVAVSFLLPHRLSRFLWFVGPANNPDASYDLWRAARFYWSVFSDGFLATSWLALPVAVLALVGAAELRRLAPGSRAVFLFALVACLGVILHPQHQGRFMSTWVFAVWICAGTGAGVLLGWLAASLSTTARGAVAAAVAALVLIVNLGHPMPAMAYSFAIRSTTGPSNLTLVRPFLPELDDAREVAVFATFGTSKLFAWVIREHCRCHRLVDDPFMDEIASREEAHRLMAERIAQSTADIIVTIDSPTDAIASPRAGWVHARMIGILDAMAEQDRYVRGNSYALPEQRATATIWRRR